MWSLISHHSLAFHFPPNTLIFLCSYLSPLLLCKFHHTHKHNGIRVTMMMHTMLYDQMCLDIQMMYFTFVQMFQPKICNDNNNNKQWNPQQPTTLCIGNEQKNKEDTFKRLNIRTLLVLCVSSSLCLVVVVVVVVVYHCVAFSPAMPRQYVIEFNWRNETWDQQCEEER